MDDKSQGIVLMEPASPDALMPDDALWPWLAAAAIAVLAILAFILVWRRRKSSATTLPGIRKAAFTAASTALAKISTTDVRDAAVQASLILRSYLSSAAGDPALYQTHEEFVARNDALLALTTPARTAADAGFSRLAALKYAPAPPPVDPAGVIADARTLLETLHHGFTA